MPGAQPGGWRAIWTPVPTCPPSQVPLCWAPPAQPSPAALVLSRLCLRAAVGLWASPSSPQASVSSSVQWGKGMLIDLLSGAFHPCSAGSRGAELSLSRAPAHGSVRRGAQCRGHRGLAGNLTACGGLGGDCSGLAVAHPPSGQLVTAAQAGVRSAAGCEVAQQKQESGCSGQIFCFLKDSHQFHFLII